MDIQYKNLEELLFQEEIKRDLLPALRICELLKQQYDFVVTNPPYLSSSLMPKELKQFTTKAYKDCKSDMFAVFIKKCIQFSESNGYVGMITPYVWMFISSYETLRNYVLNNLNISGLIQLEYNAFEAACVPVATFILHNTSQRYKGNYIKLSDFRGAENQGPKTIEAFNNHNCGYYYERKQENFNRIPGSPIAYWATKNVLKAFKGFKTLNDIGSTRKGMYTGLNDIYVKSWWEIKFNDIAFLDSHLKSKESPLKWYPYANGGEYRKWYGNKFDVVYWQHDGFKLRNEKNEKGSIRAGCFNLDFIFNEGIVWNSITSSKSSMRLLSNNSLFSSASNAWFGKDIYVVLGFLNSKVSEYMLQILNPTLNYNAGDLAKVPICDSDIENIVKYTKNCVTISKDDWDSFEISWDFKVHPLVRLSSCLWDATGVGSSMMHYYGRYVESSCPLETCFLLWQGECNERFNQLKANEEELNRIFIDIYGLQDELTPEVEDKDVTVRKADLVRDVKSFISYAVGCMFGRNSLDVEGLAYAGGEWDCSKYTTFIPDTDDIIPICDEEYFEDDIVSRFIELVSVVYGSDTLEENLKFIADALGGKGTPREVLRNYFLNDFFKDHCKIYQKRPIYWLLDSGKKNGFKALVYIHRYTPDLIARMRTGYIHPQQARYRTQIELLQEQINMAGSTSERVKLSKQLKKINEQLLELNKYEEIVHHWADKMEPMDLDNGVKVNYAKFQELLAKIK